MNDTTICIQQLLSSYYSKYARPQAIAIDWLAIKTMKITSTG